MDRLEQVEKICKKLIEQGVISLNEADVIMETQEVQILLIILARVGVI